MRDFAVLVIDDEADNASVNTKDRPTSPANTILTSPRQKSTAQYGSSSKPSRRKPTWDIRRPRTRTSTSRTSGTIPYTGVIFSREPSSTTSATVELLRACPALRPTEVRRAAAPLPAGSTTTRTGSRPPQSDLRVGPLPDSVRTAIRCFVLAGDPPGPRARRPA